MYTVVMVVTVGFSVIGIDDERIGCETVDSLADSVMFISEVFGDGVRSKQTDKPQSVQNGTLHTLAHNDARLKVSDRHCLIH